MRIVLIFVFKGIIRSLFKISLKLHVMSVHYFINLGSMKLENFIPCDLFE